MAFNNFGLTYTDILNIFSALETDFATPDGATGQSNIEDEIDIQLDKMISKMSPVALRLLEELNDVMLEDGVYSTVTTYTLPFTTSYADGTEITGYYVARDACDSVPVQGRLNACAEEQNCKNLNLCEVGYEATFTVTNSGTQVTTPDDLTDYDVYLSFRIDQDSLVLNDLKAYLRDAVACVLGSKLLLQNESEWGLLKVMCENVFMPDKKWVPRAFKSLKFWQKPWGSSITGWKVSRDS